MRVSASPFYMGPAEICMGEIYIIMRCLSFFLYGTNLELHIRNVHIYASSCVVGGRHEILYVFFLLPDWKNFRVNQDQFNSLVQQYTSSISIKSISILN